MASCDSPRRLGSQLPGVNVKLCAAWLAVDQSGPQVSRVPAVDLLAAERAEPRKPARYSSGYDDVPHVRSLFRMRPALSVLKG